MADVGRGRIVSFGVDHQPTTLPFWQRVNPAAVTDPAGGSAMVIDGGEWRWDGSAWAGVPMPSAMPRCDNQVYGCADPIRNRVIVFGGTPVGNSMLGRNGHLLAFDPVRQQMMVHGGRHGPPNATSNLQCGYRSDTWHLGDDTAPQSIPLGRCTLWLQAPVITAFALTNPHGVAKIPMSIPLDAGFAGVTPFTQGAVLSGTGPLQGIDVTAARQLVIGN